MGTTTPAGPPIIGSVACTPQAVQAGESVLVEVKSATGDTYDGSDDVHILINGVHGPKQYLQWERPGAKVVHVSAWRTGQPAERFRTTLEVSPAEPGKELPILRVRRSLASPTMMSFTIESKSERGAAPGRSRRPAQPARARLTVQERRALRVQQGHVWKTGPDEEPKRPIYHWDFGNGHSIKGPRGSMHHDFGASLDPNRLWSTFHAGVTIQNPDGSQVRLRRTITLMNPYALMKKRGVLQPPVMGDLNAVLWDKEFRASIWIHNPEDVPVTFTGRRIQPFFEDDRPSPVGLVRPLRLGVPAKTTARFSLSIPAGAISGDAIGFAVHLSGPGIQRVPLRASAYFDLPGRGRRKRLISPELGRVLDRITASGLVPRRGSVTLDELRELEAGSALWGMAGDSPRTAHLSPGSALIQKLVRDPMKPMEGGPGIVEGAECDPSNLPANVPEGFVCQATSETRWVAMPGRFMNARKGDVILSSSPGSMIMKLLRALDPPKTFSHSGIMTRNFDQLTHSTAAEDRMLAYPVGDILGQPAPTDGHRPDVVKYLWPGVITQSVQAAATGEEMKDPEAPFFYPPYLIDAFNENKSWACDGANPEVIFPLVVKPDPLLETAQVRQRLHAVADWAAAQHGKSHYRFFCYTDPTIGLTDRAPEKPGWWASGTFPTICSSLIWMAMRHAGAVMEGAALEASDVEKRAEVAPGVADGLYLYRAYERLSAGMVLYETVCQMVRDSVEQVGLIAEIGASLEDMVSDVANQILNTFESDWSDTASKDSYEWMTPSDSSAVSPDDILYWDSSVHQGLYGYSEPLVYRPPRYEMVVVSRWRKVVYEGTLRGTVTFENGPVNGVRVEIYDGMFTHTGANGQFLLEKVPEGNYVLKAELVRQDGVHLSADLPVTVRRDQTTVVSVQLALPEDLYRQAEIQCYVHVYDYEFGAAGVKQNWTDEARVLRVGPNGTHAETSVSVCTDNDIIGEALIRVDWNMDKSLSVGLTVRYYDGTDKRADLAYETDNRVKNVVPGGSKTWKRGIIDGDEVHVEMSVRNEMQQT